MYAVMLSMVCVAIVSIIGIFGVVEVKSKCHIFKKYIILFENMVEEAMQINYINEIDVLFLGKKWTNLPFYRVFDLHVLLPPDSCNRYHLMGG